MSLIVMFELAIASARSVNFALGLIAFARYASPRVLPPQSKELVGAQVTTGSSGVIDDSGIVARRDAAISVEPTGVEPTGVEPTGVEPTGVEPTGAEPSWPARSLCSTAVS